MLPVLLWTLETLAQEVGHNGQGLGTRRWVLAAEVHLVLDALPRVCAPDVATAAPFPEAVSSSNPNSWTPSFKLPRITG